MESKVYAVSEETANFVNSLRAIDNALNVFAKSLNGFLGGCATDEAINEYVELMHPIRELIGKYLMQSITESMAYSNDTTI